MKKIINALLALITAVAFGTSINFAMGETKAEPMKGAGPKNITAERISFFPVPFRCPAAPEIGCGSGAKPALLELENDDAISEAWLNDTGTLLAVVGKEKSRREDRTSAVRKVLGTGNAAPAELQGKSREKALREFLTGDHWLRGAAVDQLSRREAGIIAQRLIVRLQAEQTVSQERIKALKLAISEYFGRSFTQQNQASQGPWREELLKLGREHLTDEQLMIFREALESGYRPQPGEK